MERILKKYFWVINLIAIAIVSYVLASAVNEITGGILLRSSTEKETKKVVSFEIPSVPVKNPPPPNMVETLIARNVFNSEPEPEIPPEEEVEEEISDEIIESDLNVQLLGTLFSKKPEWSLATINSDGSSKLVKIGSKIMDDAEIIKIERRYILLLHQKKRKIVRLGGEGQKHMPQRYGSYTSSPYAPSTYSPSIYSPPIPTMDYSKGVQKVGPYEYQIDRSMLEENLKDLSSLGMQARIVPNYQNGKYEGFKLIGIRPNSLYRAIGIQSGDIIKRVNGEELNTPNKAIELFDKLRTSPSIILDIERRGQNMSLNYKIK